VYVIFIFSVSFLHVVFEKLKKKMTSNQLRLARVKMTGRPRQARLSPPYPRVSTLAVYYRHRWWAPRARVSEIDNTAEGHLSGDLNDCGAV
jgi:hypothetical protein